MRLRQTAGGLAAALRGLSVGHQPDHWPDLANISFPVVTITGGDDAKFTAIASRMQFPHETIPGVGHAVHLEAPDATAASIRRFLEKFYPVSGSRPSS